MKKAIAVLLVCMLLLVSTASALAVGIDYSTLTDAELNELIRDAMAEQSSRQSLHIPTAVNASPDKYTWYIQDYVGRNAAGFGYTSFGGYRMDEYGDGYLRLVFITEDGRYIDIDDTKDLQNYVVTGQNISPNTEVKLVFQKDGDGNEYSSLVDYQNIELIDLAVRSIDGTTVENPVSYEPISIQPSPDKYTHYIRNYVGKNVASFGYSSLGGYRMDEYGKGSIRINFVADDGAYLDPEDVNILRQYVVTAQDIAPNSELKLTFLTDNQGEEYSNLVDSMTYQSITLSVHKLDIEYPQDTASKPEAEDETNATETTQAEVAPVVVDGSIHDYRDIQYRIIADGTAEVCGYTRAKSNITIPSEVDGVKVTAIADGAFEACEELVNLLNWADLTYIGASAFKGCTSLSDISIPSETTFIGESAFEDCTSLKTVIMWGDPTSVEKNTFKNCTELTDISLSSSVTSIGESAFENCSNLSTVIMWGDITAIETRAFFNCDSLDDISISSSCEVIEESAFEGCTALSTVILWGDTNIGNSAFKNCTSLEDISISSGTEYIGDNAFEGCSSLENVTMWGRTTKIGKDAFADCPMLSDIPE